MHDGITESDNALSFPFELRQIIQNSKYTAHKPPFSAYLLKNLNRFVFILLRRGGFMLYRINDIRCHYNSHNDESVIVEPTHNDIITHVYGIYKYIKLYADH